MLLGGGEGGVGGLPHQATWLALFALLINYSLILAYHDQASFLHKQCNNVDAF